MILHISRKHGMTVRLINQTSLASIIVPSSVLVPIRSAGKLYTIKPLYFFSKHALQTSNAVKENCQQYLFISCDTAFNKVRYFFLSASSLSFTFTFTFSINVQLNVMLICSETLGMNISSSLKGSSFMSSSCVGKNKSALV